MNRLHAAGWALGGAAVTALAIYTVPILSPTHEPNEEPAETTEVAPPPGQVQIDKADISRAGINIITLRSASDHSQQTGFARGIDVGALAAIASEISSAHAAYAASQAEAQRQQALAAQDQSASVQAVEAARAQATADRARLELANRRIGLEYGAGLARMNAAQISALVRDVAAGRAMLVRLDFPDLLLPAGSSVTIHDGERAGTVRVLGAASSADAHLQTPGMLAIAIGPMVRALSVGRTLAATAAGGRTQDGITIPRNAIVRWQGGLWVYRALPDGSFKRVELRDARPTDGGWFTTRNFKAGDRLAVDGAGVLLAVEHGSAAEPEEE
jgi:hypothetical protein